MAMLQRDASRDWRERIARFEAEVEALVRPLSEAQRAWRPPTGGWGIAMVLGHLRMAGQSYVERVDALLARGGHRAADGDERWAPSFMGGFIARSLAAPRKLPAPPRWRPAAEPPAEALDAMLATDRAILALLDRAAPLAWRSIRTSSPVSPLIRLNLGDVFAIHAVHVERHLGQMRRVRAEPAFPAA